MPAKRRTKSKSKSSCAGGKRRTKSKSKTKKRTKSKSKRSRSKQPMWGGADCGPGQIERVGYTRSDGTYVEPACVKDMGAPGKAAGTESAILPPIEDTGFFTKHGFELYDKRKRDHAIKAAIAELIDEGMTHDEAVTKVIQHIVLPMNYSKNQPHPHEAWQEALDYAQSLR